MNIVLTEIIKYFQRFIASFVSIESVSNTVNPLEFSNVPNHLQNCQKIKEKKVFFKKEIVLYTTIKGCQHQGESNKKLMNPNLIIQPTGSKD